MLCVICLSDVVIIIIISSSELPQRFCFICSGSPLCNTNNVCPIPTPKNDSIRTPNCRTCLFSSWSLYPASGYILSINIYLSVKRLHCGQIVKRRRIVIVEVVYWFQQLLTSMSQHWTVQILLSSLKILNS